MPTFTYRDARQSLGQITQDLRLFRYRLIRAEWWDGPSTFPYLWTPERGKKGTHRLHVHMGVEWWGRLGCVEVCDRCATSNLRKKRSDIPAAGSHCVGCIWQHGFVGAPSEGTGDPRALAGYVSKYVGKDLGDLLDKGQQRYRVGEGFQPEAVRDHGGDNLVRALMTVAERFGVEVEDLGWIALHDVVEGWEAPPTWVVRNERDREGDR